MKTVLITGNTFPVKDQIKALGGKWDGDNKGWKVPADKADEARKLVDGAPTKAVTSGSGSSASKSKPKRYFSNCADCGCATHGWYRCKDCNMERKDGGGMHMGGMSYRDSRGNFVLGDDD